MPQHPAFQNIKSVFLRLCFLCAGCVKKTHGLSQKIQAIYFEI